MKKFTKVSLIIVAVLAGLGILLCGIASLMGAGAGTIYGMAKAGELDYGSWHIGPYGIYTGEDEDDWFDEEEHGVMGESSEKGKNETKDGESIEVTNSQSFAVSDIKNLNVNVDVATLYIEENSDTEHISVELNRGGQKYYSCSLDGDTLNIVYDIKKYIVNNKGAKITVKIPQGVHFEDVVLKNGAAELIMELPGISCDTMTADMGAGNLVAERIEVKRKMDISIGAGSVEIEDGSYGELKLKCGMGNIELGGKLKGNMVAECGMGNIDLDLQGSETDYNYELSCGMGELEINDTSYSNIGGNKSITNVDTIGTITLECGMGNIDLDIE